MTLDPLISHRLFDTASAFDHPVTRFLTLGCAGLLVGAPITFLLLKPFISPKTRHDIWIRYRSWFIFIPMMFGPVLLGAAYVIFAVTLLALFCFREFARATGLFRENIVCFVVILGILALNTAAFDHWYNFFTALMPLTIAVLLAAAILSDTPAGYIQRVALAIFAFMLFGACFGHLAFFANDSLYRPILLWLISSIELNDVFAYVCGKTFGHRKLAPNTSPNKTLGGAIGALVLTITFAAAIGHFVFIGTSLDSPVHLLALGAILSAAGQLGDLTLSSIKRDLGIKDWANTFPGHGGLLDRFNSLLLAAPAAFHYIGYVKPNGIGLDQPPRILF